MFNPGLPPKWPRQAANFDTLVNNCSGWIPNSNCVSNALHTPPNAYPSTWGGSPYVGFAWGNPSGFDFAGGASVADVGISGYPFTRVYATTSTPTLGNVTQTNRNMNNCNCNSPYGTGVFNCYNNCNCNCACACACVCDCACLCVCGK